MPWCLEEVWPGCWLRGSSADHFEEVTLIERDVYLTNMEVEERRRKPQYFETRRETDAPPPTRVAKVVMEVFNIQAPPAVLFQPRVLPCPVEMMRRRSRALRARELAHDFSVGEIGRAPLE